MERPTVPSVGPDMHDEQALSPEDCSALNALSTALADAAAMHRAGAAAADHGALRERMKQRAARLETLTAETDLSPSGTGSASSVLGLLDRLRLDIDRLFGDDDVAAVTASREAMAHLVRLIDGQLQNTELSPDVLASFAEIRAQIVFAAPDAGLKSLPS